MIYYIFGSKKKYLPNKAATTTTHIMKPVGFQFQEKGLYFCKLKQTTKKKYTLSQQKKNERRKK
jgi:hypothetical protein